MYEQVVRVIDVVDGALASVVPEHGPGARRWRLGAAAVVCLTGTALLVPNLTPLTTGGGSALALALSAFGTLVSAALVGAGYLLARSDLDAANAVRIALWNVLGVVVLGVVLGANLWLSGGSALDAPSFVVGNVLAVGAGAHVIIGVYDARRVRADQLDRERQKLAVLGRVLRHNLRNEATVIIGHGERLEDGVTDPTLRESAAAVSRAGRTVGSLADRAEEMMTVVERGDAPSTEVDARAVTQRVVERARERHPGVAIALETDDDGGPERYLMWADDDFETALAHLVENAVEHGTSDGETGGRNRSPAVAGSDADGTGAGDDGDAPLSAAREDGGSDAASTVTVSLARRDDRVTVTVRDDGPGIAPVEREVVTGETAITQLTHGSGLGLWVVQAVVESGGGDLRFEDPPTGAAVTMSHRAVAN